MILRLKTEEELQLLQSRIKAKCPSKVHVSDLRSETATQMSRQNGSKRSRIGLRGAEKKKTASDKDYWALLLQKQCLEGHLPIPVLEHRFHPERRWRFDCAWRRFGDDPWVAVEINGGVWNQGRHTRGLGYIKDMEKRNEANRLGWHLFEFTPNQVKTRQALEYLKKVLSP